MSDFLIEILKSAKSIGRITDVHMYEQGIISIDGIAKRYNRPFSITFRYIDVESSDGSDNP